MRIYFMLKEETVMKMLHVTIQTNKPEEEINFYREYAGLTVQDDLRDKGKDIVFLGNSAGETCIEVLYNPDSDNAGNRYLSVGFKAEDISAQREKMIEAGFAPTPMVSPMPGVEFFFVTDPAGVTVQFM
ncbi:MAG: VOC family protein [Lentihominibacter sp.]|nr:VOC family protein [Lentihominibacter sp.]